MNNRLSALLMIALMAISFTSYGHSIVDNKSKKANYHSVIAKKGDGVFSLLRRYNLNSNSCDVQKFYSLNNLKRDEHLVAKKVYILPVLIYKYNSISIRSSISDDDWEKAVRIQKYNEFLLKNKLRKTSYRDSKILWVPHHEISCDSKPSSKPPLNETTTKNITTTKKESTTKKEITSTSKNETIKKTTSPKKPNDKNTVKNKKSYDNYDNLFGKKYSKFKREDNSLANQVFYVVSGHGGPDPGARCTSCSTTMCEDEYAYDVALRLVRDLKQHGAIVHMIIQDANDGIRDEQYLKCDHDETCTGKKIPLDQLQRLRQRTTTINKLYKKYKKQGIKKQKAIMIHVDSNHKKKEQDTFFYYYTRSKSGKKLAFNIQSTFKKMYAKYQKGRGYHGSVRTRGLYMLRNTHPTSVYVELGNIRNKKNQKRLLYKENRQALANWLFEGLIK